jgi:hypothetical protein
MNAEPLAPLPPATHRDLMLAISQLERESLIARLAQATGTPVDIAIKYLPKTERCERLKAELLDASTLTVSAFRVTPSPRCRRSSLASDDRTARRRSRTNS